MRLRSTPRDGEVSPERSIWVGEVKGAPGRTPGSKPHLLLRAPPMLHAQDVLPSHNSVLELCFARLSSCTCRQAASARVPGWVF